MELLICWRCGAPVQHFAGEKIPFRLVCDRCLTAQHCCKNCKYYLPGKPNDCLVPGTDYIADRQAINFCEEFQLGPKKEGPKGPSVDDITKRLFGD